MFKFRELKMDWRAAVALIVGTLLLVTDSYRTFFGNELWTRTILYLVIPLVTILVVFRESPARYGMQLGDWRAGLLFTAAACLVLVGVMLFVARTPAMQNYYRRVSSDGLPFWLADGIELFGWEFFFRGFLFFALYRACGPIALILQAVPFALAHVGKPELETLSCIFGGTAYAYVAWRTRSFLYPFLIHWFLALFTTMVAAGLI
ncbi:MAG: CPBP family intramembrane metalloprotease [Anaerolineae bacterium]|nr:CPBP family intramembrane metalloprotease [Anaerolineae bacterium]